MHLWLSLPTAIENGGARILEQDKEVIETDGGYEVRNTRWAGPLRSWHIAFNNAPLASANHAAVEAMFRNTNGGTDTFNFADERTGDTARVRFDVDLQFTHAVGSFHHLDTFTLKEVRDVSPIPTIAPVIAGAATVGGTLTLSTGTYSGSPTSYARQWTVNGVDIGGATGNTYTPVSGDIGKLISGYVVATDASGGQTKTWANSVGPIV